MLDITTALAGPSQPKRSAGVKRKRPATDDAGPPAPTADGDDDDERAIQHAMSWKAKQDGAAATATLAKSTKGKATKPSAGAFQSMGLHAPLLKALLMRGFTTPTPIQRLAMPSIIASPPRDLVGMARTGSGKTLAYLVPLIHRLGARHSPTFGCRALVLVPTRELALQVLKVGKDLGRGARDEGEGLRWGLVVGGEGLDDQFDMISSNPDVIIATPGRLLHLVVEMNLDFRAISYVVFDEADRLFEMGFETQLHEVLHRLPPTRQTLLFSATLPKSLVEFAKAGLQNPKLVRLDAESKISADLQMAFLSIKPIDKEAALLCLLRDVIEVPPSDGRQAPDFDEDEGGRNRPPSHGKGKGRDRGGGERKGKLLAHQTLVFAATKHHVEYLSNLLIAAGYAVAQIYGSMDHGARQQQLSSFRLGYTNVLVVTDIAARGIDIPVLENVINYDFPVGPRTFVHRVGRTARAGRKGWAYSLVTNNELAHLFELELFLSRSILACPLTDPSSIDYAGSLILGTLPRDKLDIESEHVRHVLVGPSPALSAMQGVAERGQQMYERSQTKASAESHRRAKALIREDGNGLAGSSIESSSVHPIFGTASAPSSDAARAALLATVQSFRPAETVFEIGTRGKAPAAGIMQSRRKTMAGKEASSRARAAAAAESAAAAEADEDMPAFDADEPIEATMADADMSDADDADLEAVFDLGTARKTDNGWRDQSVYMGYEQSGAAAEKGYSINEGNSFAAQASQATFTLDNDELKEAVPQRASTLRWDRKQKRIVKAPTIGADNKKLIRTESGARVPASFKSGAFDDWRAKKRTSVPRVGEAELPSSRGRFAGGRGGGAHFRHKAADPATSVRGKARSSVSKAAIARGGGKGRKLLAGGGLRSVDDMARERRAKESRVRRSTQPGSKGSRGGGGGSTGAARAPRGGGAGTKFGGGGKPRSKTGSGRGGAGAGRGGRGGGRGGRGRGR